MKPKRDPTMLLEDFFTEVYLPMRLLGASKATIQQYTIGIHTLEKYLKRVPLVGDLNEATVAGFVQHELARGMAVATVNGRLRYIFSLARMVRSRGLYEADMGDVRKLKEKRSAPIAWTDGEMVAIIKSCRLCRCRFLGVPSAGWWESLVLLTYDTGLRHAAATAVRFDEIDFATGMLRVPAERMKNGVEQFFRLHPQTIEAILGTLPPKRKLLFPWPFRHQGAFYGRFKAILKRAGLPYGKKDLFHKIRRTTASHTARLLGAGVASMQLGHQDPTTIRRYIDPRFTSRHDAADFMPRPAWENPREIVVETTEVKRQELAEREVVRYPLEYLRGDGDDVFERLKHERNLTGADVKDALDALGMNASELASQLGITPRSLQRMLREKKPLAIHLGQRIRTALGICVRGGGGGE